MRAAAQLSQYLLAFSISSRLINMPLSSTIASPINRIPYDILTEIFHHCLPQRRLEHRQPDTMTAPMLLCHICSSWRTIALEIPTLWSHLSYRLAIAAHSNDFLKSNWIVLEDQYAFLLWWQKNQGAMAPSLCLDFNWRYDKMATQLEFELDLFGMIALFEYISSARYLEVDALYWYIIEDRIKSGYPIACPNPLTLVKSGWEFEEVDRFYEVQLALSPNHTPSALRHLHISGNLSLKIPVIPSHVDGVVMEVLRDERSRCRCRRRQMGHA